MAGHSKFKNIQHRKGAQDKKRAKIFSKLGREITVAAKLGPDQDFNPRLRLAIANAKAENMPKDNIERAIRKGSSEDDGLDYVEIRYEGYGPAGVAIIVEALTDNRNRTASDVRSAFSKFSGNLGETNSVNFMFDRIGLIQYPLSAGSADKVFEAAVEAGADNVESSEDGHEVTTTIEQFTQVRDQLEKALGAPNSATLTWKPKMLTAVTDPKTVQTLMKLIDVLEDNDDVQSVCANFDIAEDLLNSLEG